MSLNIYTTLYLPMQAEPEFVTWFDAWLINRMVGTDGLEEQDPENRVWEVNNLTMEEIDAIFRRMHTIHPKHPPIIAHTDIGTGSYEGEYDGQIDWMDEAGVCHSCPSYKNVVEPLITVSDLLKNEIGIYPKIPKGFYEDPRFTSWIQFSQRLDEWDRIDRLNPPHGAFINVEDTIPIARSLALMGQSNLAATVLSRCSAEVDAEERALIERFITRAQGGTDTIDNDGAVECDSPAGATSVSLSEDGGAYVLCWAWVSNAEIGIPDEDETPEEEEYDDDEAPGS